MTTTKQWAREVGPMGLDRHPSARPGALEVALAMAETWPAT